jgi:hypothetical protein
MEVIRILPIGTQKSSAAKREREVTETATVFWIDFNAFASRPRQLRARRSAALSPVHVDREEDDSALAARVYLRVGDVLGQRDWRLALPCPVRWGISWVGGTC